MNEDKGKGKAEGGQPAPRENAAEQIQRVQWERAGDLQGAYDGLKPPPRSEKEATPPVPPKEK